VFLALPRPIIPPPAHRSHAPPALPGSTEAARRLFGAGKPIPDTPAEAYLRARGITAPLDWPTLRFHPPPITDEKSRTALLQLFTKARMGWCETAVHQHEGEDGAKEIVFNIVAGDVDGDV
jgi:hypothetical protein